MQKRKFYLLLFSYVFILVLVPRFLKISIHWILLGELAVTFFYLFWFWQQEKKNVSYNREAVKILEDECDPYRFLKVCQEGCIQYAKTILQKATAQSNIALGYFLSGETEKAIAIEKELQRKNEKEWKQFVLELTCIANLSAMYFSKRDEEKLKEQADKLARAARKIKKGVPVEQTVQRLIKRIEVYLCILEGNPQDVQAWCLEQFEKAESEYARVSIQYELALIYEAGGQTERQKECLIYVAEHGNLLQLVQEANNKLLQME